MQDTYLTTQRPLPSSHFGYVGPQERFDCGQCITRNAEHYGFPPLDGRYAEAWRLFMLLHDQQRVGMEPIGLDYTVLPAVFDLEGIVDPRERRRLFGELVALNHALQAYQGEQRDERKRQRERDAATAKLRGGRR